MLELGKRIFVQRRGRGSLLFRSPSHKRRGEIKHPPIPLEEASGCFSGVILDLLHDPGRGAPIAKVKFEDDQERLILISEQMYVGQEIEYGEKATLALGNTLPLFCIPEGTPIFNIEGSLGDGGKFVRSSGTYATIMSQAPDKTIVKLPSGKMKSFNPKCRATIGLVAGGGRTDKPFVKAGKKFHMAKTKGWKYPKVRGVAMAAVSHPFGGGAKQRPGRSSTTSRHAPPGAKVGLIAARRSGRKKRK